MNTINSIFEMHIQDFMYKILAASLAGLLIGLERQYKGKSAGLKTNTIVAIGASIFIMLSLEFENRVGVDITRVLGQIVVGVGFLGAGVIVQRKDKIKGLTTAATIWCSAAAGCLAAYGFYGELAFATVVIVAINLVFGWVDVRFFNK
ncbi:Mg(2+) transport protein C, mgtC family protein [Galbibacter marinus]|uniref:Mg(2+) transport protein C, mgtC family protein n=1 Tax=Galbibacter marinus TaxID=555500 RepID=K2PWZ9_9FLAO|nr:MgtC/SapB family protein [Galbibacter marinus]EKF56004.1 Mg(2+) transport protein C, mgtC family protein [Galbibacter marinus]